MRTFTRILATLFAVALSATLALAHGYKLGNLEIHHPWAKATVEGQPVAGGFMKITNSGTEADRLIAVSSNVAGMLQLHEMKVEDGVMKMAEIPGGVEIPAGQTVELKPGGLHVMFMGLKAQFKEGETVKAVLTFEKAGTIEVEFKVEAANKGGMDHSTHQTQ
jgi:copper(I)-binding protein